MALPTPEDFTRYLQHPIHFPDEFKDWISDYSATNLPKIPISQIYGFKLQSVKEAPEVPTQEGTASTAYGDLATVGPTLTDIPNGIYIVAFGAWCNKDQTNVQSKYMNVSLDGAAPVDANESTWDRYGSSAGRIALVDFSSGTGAHTIVCKYKVDAGGITHYFRDRWLHAIKVVTE